MYARHDCERAYARVDCPHYCVCVLGVCVFVVCFPGFYVSPRVRVCVSVCVCVCVCVRVRYVDFSRACRLSVRMCVSERCVCVCVCVVV